MRVLFRKHCLRLRAAAYLARCLHFGLLGDFQCVIDLDTEVAHRTLKLGVSQQKLDRSEVLRAAVDERRLRAAHRVGAVSGRVKPNGRNPLINDSAVLPRGEVRRCP